jgi:hypothetical protein
MRLAPTVWQPPPAPKVALVKVIPCDQCHDGTMAAEAGAAAARTAARSRRAQVVALASLALGLMWVLLGAGPYPMTITT